MCRKHTTITREADTRTPLAILACFAILLALPTCSTEDHTALVARVIDGDTIELDSGERVRYIGINTPETVHPHKAVEFMGKEATAFNKALTEGNRVRLEFDVEKRDRYGRLLAYVFVDTLFVNAELVRQGYANVATFPPNVRHAEHFLGLERKAREAGRGLWNGNAIAEWEQTHEANSAHDGSAIVYVTDTGKKYHRGDCSHLQKSKRSITLKKAKQLGYEPCSRCRPPR
jgi:micrococcal nuclease